MISRWAQTTSAPSRSTAPPVEEAEIPARADAALLCLVHDITRPRRALENVVRQLEAGGRIAVFGGKVPPRWALPLHLLGRAIMARYVTTLEGAEEPWSLLEPMIPDLSVETSPLRDLPRLGTAGRRVGD